jgi:hypothetical protein
MIILSIFKDKTMKKLTLALLISCTLAGCGIKPSSVEPPEGSEGTVFPRTYPAPEEN